MKLVTTNRLLMAMAAATATPALGQAASNHTFNTYEGTTPDTATPTSPQAITGAGATLFVDFFKSPASTNDFLDIDTDGTAGGAGFIDQLAPSVALSNSISWDDGPSTASPSQNYWMFQYRSVGSANGFQEFVNYQATRNSLISALPTQLPSENGLINRSEWVDQNGEVNYGPANGSTDQAALGIRFCLTAPKAA